MECPQFDQPYFSTECSMKASHSAISSQFLHILQFYVCHVGCVAVEIKIELVKHDVSEYGEMIHNCRDVCRPLCDYWICHQQLAFDC